MVNINMDSGTSDYVENDLKAFSSTLRRKEQTLEAEAICFIDDQSNRGIPLNVNQILYVPEL